MAPSIQYIFAKLHLQWKWDVICFIKMLKNASQMAHSESTKRDYFNCGTVERMANSNLVIYNFHKTFKENHNVYMCTNVPTTH